MATIDKTKGRAAVPSMMDGAARFQLYNEVDLTGGGVTSGDVYQVLKVCKGMRVYGVQVQVVTPATGTSLTANVGDDDAASGYDASIDLKATAGTVYRTAIGTDSYGAAGKLYTTDDTIDLTVTASSITAGPKLKIWADCEWFKNLT